MSPCTSIFTYLHGGKKELCACVGGACRCGPAALRICMAACVFHLQSRQRVRARETCGGPCRCASKYERRPLAAARTYGPPAWRQRRPLAAARTCSTAAEKTAAALAAARAPPRVYDVRDSGGMPQVPQICACGPGRYIYIWTSESERGGVDFLACLFFLYACMA